MNRVSSLKLAIPNLESTQQYPEQLLQDVLAAGLTYDDLVAEGMHPAFLNQLFLRLNLQSPGLQSRPPSVPQLTATPDIMRYTTPPIQKSYAADAETFLDNLEPALSTSNGRQDSRKRGYSGGNDPQPQKRRAFGLAPPRELVIDISDDDDDGEESPVKPAHQTVTIQDRPSLTQQAGSRRIC
jgi:hypothetical protein